MKMLFIDHVQIDLSHIKNITDYKDHALVTENGCVLGIKIHNDETLLVEILDRKETEELFSAIPEGIFNLANFYFELKDHPEYYFLEKGWLLKICQFLEKAKTFSITAFSGSVRFSADYKESRKITQSIINNELIPSGYVARYATYYRLTKEGEIWIKEQIRISSGDIQKDVQTMIKSALTFVDARIHELQPFKNIPINQLISTMNQEIAKLKGAKPSPAIYLKYYVVRLFFHALLPISTLPQVLTLIKCSQLEYDREYALYSTLIKEMEETDEEAGRKSDSNIEDEIDETSNETEVQMVPPEDDTPVETPHVKHRPVSAPSKNKNPAPKNKKSSAPTKKQIDSPHLNDDAFLLSKNDSSIKLIKDPVYLKQRKVEICRHHFNGQVSLFHSKEHITQLAKMFKSKDKSLQLHMPADCQNLLAVLLFNKKLTRQEIYDYIKKHSEYKLKHITLEEIIKRTLEIGLM